MISPFLFLYSVVRGLTHSSYLIGTASEVILLNISFLLSVDIPGVRGNSGIWVPIFYYYFFLFR